MRYEPVPFLQPVSGVLRVYKHEVGATIWKRVLRHISQSPGLYKWVKITGYVNYRAGSALEGNLVHWVANRQKHRGFRIIRRNFKKWNLGDDYD